MSAGVCVWSWGARTAVPTQMTTDRRRLAVRTAPTAFLVPHATGFNPCLSVVAANSNCLQRPQTNLGCNLLLQHVG